MRIRPLLCGLLLAAAAATASATTIVVPTDDELFAASRAVVAGRVAEIRSRRVEGAISTYVSIDVETVFAGDLAPGRIVLREMGGRVGDDFTVVYGVPEYAVGERVLVYLDTNDEGVWRTAFMLAGKFTVVSRAGRDHVVRRRDAEGVRALAPSGAGATTDAAPLHEYTAALARRAAARPPSRSRPS